MHGITVPLLAGGCVVDIIPIGGAFALNMRSIPSSSYWYSGSALSSLISFVYYMYEINRWNRLALFHLLIISYRKEMRELAPFIKLFIKFAASFGKFMDQLSDMTDYPVRLLKGIAAIGLVIAILEDCMINGGEHAIYIAMSLIALVRL